jgi:hypothetical protein
MNMKKYYMSEECRKELTRTVRDERARIVGAENVLFGGEITKDQLLRAMLIESGIITHVKYEMVKMIGKSLQELNENKLPLENW